MWVWCGKSGYDLGIGKSEYSIRSREVLMCSDRYADDIPLALPNTQLPPTRSDFSKQSNGMPRSWRALAAAIPEDPAPIRHADGSSVVLPVSGTRATVAKDDGGVKFSQRLLRRSRCAGARGRGRVPRGSS